MSISIHPDCTAVLPLSSDSYSKFAMRLAYVGSEFCGWQKQQGEAASGAPSIQETIEKGLSKLYGTTVRIVGSGRTDAGVHAAAQVAHFTLEHPRYDMKTLRKAINSTLPSTIRVLEVFPVAVEFHAQRSAVSKQYSYYFQQGPCHWPALRKTTLWVRRKLDVEAMHEAVQCLRGEHDFAIFQASGGTVKTTVRTIFEAAVTRQEAPFPDLQHGLGQAFELVRLRLKGNGFLKQMVRSIAGTLLQVGEGRRTVESFQGLLKGGKRSDLGVTASPQGLWLEGVWYDEPFDLPGAIE